MRPSKVLNFFLVLTSTATPGPQKAAGTMKGSQRPPKRDKRHFSVDTQQPVFMFNSRNDPFGRPSGPFRGVPGWRLRPKIQYKSRFLAGAWRWFSWYPTTWALVGFWKWPFWEAAGTLWRCPGGPVRLNIQKTSKFLMGSLRRFRWYSMSRVWAEIWDFQKFGVFPQIFRGSRSSDALFDCIVRQEGLSMCPNGSQMT